MAIFILSASETKAKVKFWAKVTKALSPGWAKAYMMPMRNDLGCPNLLGLGFLLPFLFVSQEVLHFCNLSLR